MVWFCEGNLKGGVHAEMALMCILRPVVFDGCLGFLAGEIREGRAVWGGSVLPCGFWDI